jgi:hypothetical protein
MQSLIITKVRNKREHGVLFVPGQVAILKVEGEGRPTSIALRRIGTAD